jgi:hypothetical protein
MRLYWRNALAKAKPMLPQPRMAIRTFSINMPVR